MSMFHYVIYFFLILSLESCSNDTKENLSNVHKEDDIIVNQEDKSNKFSIEDHPCLCLTSSDKISSVNIPSTYNKSKYADKFNIIDFFNISIESSNIFENYTQYFNTLEKVILRKEIDEYFNPKAYFIKAISEINKSQLEQSKYSLLEFLSIKENYNKDNNRYYQLGCYQNDIEYIENFETTITYQIANELLDYVNSRLSGDIDKSAIDNLVKTLYLKYDKTPSIIDLVDNVVFSVLKSEGISPSQYIKLDSDIGILYTPLHDMFKDGREFHLSSQLELLMFAKFYEAQKAYNQFDWDKINQNLESTKIIIPFPDWGIDTKHLYSLMHFYEFKLDIMNEKDQILFDRIGKIIDALGYDNCLSWLKQYDPKKNFSDSKIREIHKKLSLNSSPDALILYIESITEEQDSTLFFKTRELLVNEYIFDSISSDTIKFIIEKPNDDYKYKIDKFLDLATNYEIPGSYRFVVDIPKNYYAIYNMNNATKREDISLSLAGDRIYNEANDAVANYWNFVRSYFEIDNSGVSTNRCN